MGETTFTGASVFYITVRLVILFEQGKLETIFSRKKNMDSTRFCLISSEKFEIL